MNDYLLFLEEAGLPTEEEFESLIDSLPEVDFGSIDFYSIDLEDLETIAIGMMEAILKANDLDEIFISDVDVDEKTYCVEHCSNKEELDKVKDLFPEWTLENYDDTLEWIDENKVNEEYNAKREFISSYLSNIPMEDLKEFVKKYE
jgi:hypothetical protein